MLSYYQTLLLERRLLPRCSNRTRTTQAQAADTLAAERHRRVEVEFDRLANCIVRGAKQVLERVQGRGLENNRAVLALQVHDADLFGIAVVFHLLTAKARNRSHHGLVPDVVGSKEALIGQFAETV